MEKKTVYTVVAVIVAAILLVVGFVLLKQHKDRVAPTPPPVVETPVVEEPPEEEPQPRARRRRDVSSSISRVVPVQNNQVQGMPTREEAVDAARDILYSYREATPQEKQQMAMAMNMASYMIAGIAQSAGQFVQRMTPEQRDQLLKSSQASQELLNAIQEEMAFEVTPEETQVFGGVFQSLQYMNQTLLNSSQF